MNITAGLSCNCPPRESPKHPRVRHKRDSGLEMANGQVVLITTERLGEAPATRTVYYVAEEDSIKAEAIVAAVMAPNETVVAYGQLPEAAVKAMGLKPGEFRQAPMS